MYRCTCIFVWVRVCVRARVGRRRDGLLAQEGVRTFGCHDAMYYD